MVTLFCSLISGFARFLMVTVMVVAWLAYPVDCVAQGEPGSSGVDLSGLQSGPVGIPEKGPDEEPFVVGVGDVLQISVWREPEVSVAAVTVRPDGKISVPLIKEVYVSGLTPMAIEQELTRKFEQLINSPVVTVIVKETHSQQVILSGGVARPGLLEIKPGMTVMHALSIAGGVREYAKRKKIFVIRTVDSRQVTIPFDYTAVITGKDPSKDFLLEAGDMIVVPE